MPGQSVAGLVMLELKDVSRSSGRDPVLTMVSVQIARNVPTSVVGLSPVERAMLLRLLAGADRPQSGAITLDGKDIAEARRGKGRIVQIGKTGVKPSGQRLGKQIGKSTAERVGLGGKLEARIGDLDLDQRLRVAIALAREEKPVLILLSAPSAELDHGIRERFLADLGPMLADTGAVVVLLAGSVDEAAGLGGDVVVLSNGRLVQSGAAKDVFAHPANLAAALATSHPALNMLPMSARNGSGVLPDGSTFQPPDGVALPKTGDCTLAFRPEDTLFERHGATCVRFVVRAAGEESISGRRFVRLTFAGSTWLTPQPAVSLPPGAMLNAFVDRARLMVFGAEGDAIPQADPIAFSRGAGSSLATDSPGG
jgi:ABC-type sulfate/molybdate transport systems ATPase subunit